MPDKETPAPSPRYDYGPLEKEIIQTYGGEKVYKCLDETLYCLAARSSEDPGDPAFMDRYHLVWALRNTLGKLERRG